MASIQSVPKPLVCHEMPCHRKTSFMLLSKSHILSKSMVVEWRTGRIRSLLHCISRFKSSYAACDSFSRLQASSTSTCSGNTLEHVHLASKHSATDSDDKVAEGDGRTELFFRFRRKTRIAPKQRIPKTQVTANVASAAETSWTLVSGVPLLSASGGTVTAPKMQKELFAWLQIIIPELT